MSALREELQQLRHDSALYRVRAALEARELLVPLLADLTTAFDKELRWTSARMARHATADGRALSKPTHLSSTQLNPTQVKPSQPKLSQANPSQPQLKAWEGLKPKKAAAEPRFQSSQPPSSKADKEDAELLGALQREIDGLRQSMHRALQLACRTLRGRLLPIDPSRQGALDDDATQGPGGGRLGAEQLRWLRECCTLLFPHCLVCVFDPCAQDDARSSPWRVRAADPTPDKPTPGILHLISYALLLCILHPTT